MDKEIENKIKEYYEKKKKFQVLEKKLKELKADFDNTMLRYFQDNDISDEVAIKNDETTSIEYISVKKCQKVKLIFDADKLEKNLKKSISKDIIIKDYKINDIDGFIAYAKECGMNPKVLKSFLSVTKSVDVNEIDSLEQLGKISIDDLKGCYTINKSAPYFTVSVKRNKKEYGNGNQ